MQPILSKSQSGGVLAYRVLFRLSSSADNRAICPLSALFAVISAAASSKNKNNKAPVSRECDPISSTNDSSPKAPPPRLGFLYHLMRVVYMRGGGGNNNQCARRAVAMQGWFNYPRPGPKRCDAIYDSAACYLCVDLRWPPPPPPPPAGVDPSVRVAHYFAACEAPAF
jgi:hypothetical protein